MALLWGGLSLSAIGDQLYAVALSWIAVGVLGAHAGYLVALQALVVLLVVMGIGRWADAWDHRRSMVAADLVRAAVLVGVVLAWWMQGGPTAAALVMAVIVLALGQAVFQPAMQAILPEVVGEAALLPAANGLLDATDRSARLLGPGLVGLLAGVVPVMHFLTIDALSFGASALALSLIGRIRPGLVAPSAHRTQGPGAQGRGAEGRGTQVPIWRGILTGIAAMRGHRLLGFVLTAAGPINGAWYAAFYLGLPLMIEQRGIVWGATDGGVHPGGSGLGAYGLVMSAYGATNLLATVLLGGRPLPRRPQFQMFAGNLLVGVGVVLLGLAGLLPQPWVLPGFAAAAALGAFGGPMKDIPLAVLRQTRLPLGHRAPAMRAYMAAGSAGLLVAMLAMPSLLARFGAVRLTVACGLVLALLGATGLWRHRAWIEPA